MVNRGRSIPVLDLALMIGSKPAVLGHDASVLVVESAGEWVGFAVPELKTIEVAAWEMDMPAARAAGSTASALTGQDSRQPARPLALVGTADDERLLPMLHLREMAGQIQRSGASLRG